ncbi:N-acetylmuramoyl-L-alanine amidase family protein [Beduini massiliensis]|uniref:N-acetylmuramoyl-L-alanine amidase family protein n=1 Tax=Beduini massiliensis TaxID=1585974 RepID=UPI0035634E0E
MIKKRIKYGCGCAVLMVLVIGSLHIIKSKIEIKSVIDQTESASLNPVVYQTVVCLDAGHGGDDVGAEYNGRYEKDDDLTITLAVKKELESLGVEVILTRSQDISMDNAPRAEYANLYDAAVLVSIHRNYYEGYEAVNGIEAWINSQFLQEDELLAAAILEVIEEAVPKSTIRGVKGGTMDGEGNYTINRVAQMPSCILELGFISSDYDNTLLDTYFSDYAAAIAQGIYTYIQTFCT